MRKEIIIDENLVSEIQLKDATVGTMRAVVKEIIEAHALDDTNPVINSPVFVGYQKKLSEAEVEFSKAKDAMIHKVLDDETRSKLLSWSLDYFTCTLTYEIKE